MHEKVIFEKLFDRDGYVLNFNDKTFAEFFREHGINIEANKYHINGRSKMKRLRAFWEIESDKTVSQVLKDLLEYACAIESVNSYDKAKAIKIILRLQKGNREQITEQESEDIFLKREFKNISIQKLNLDLSITQIIEQRMQEIEQCLHSKSVLATIFLCGSTLEGILLGVALQKTKEFNSTKACPKDKNKKVLPFQKWTLSSLIDVAKEVELLNEDVQKFSHSLRNFRNYIHPYQQAVKKFNPDEHTAKLCFQVLKTAIFQLSKNSK